MAGWTKTARAIGPVAALALAGCSGGPLDPHGPVASGERQILFDALGIMLALIIPTMLGGAWVGWWFRDSNRKRARYLPDFSFSGRIEILIWSVPTLIIVFLGGLIWFGSHQLDPGRPLESAEKPIEVQVVSLDWKWLFIYPEEGVASVNELVLPEGTPVHLQITSASVMNTFWVPQLAGMIYSMNGMVTQLHLLADHPGEFAGRSGNLSGDGFSDMRFVARSMTRDGFGGWVAKTKADGPALDRAAYEKLQEQSIADRPVTYREVDPALFHAIVTQQIPPSAGPREAGRAGLDVHPTPAEK